ncbi:hypothetical protein [Streptococcus chenjunshii]|nr:hypothetical protein [Streptococcus chenjunshii]
MLEELLYRGVLMTSFSKNQSIF